VVALQLVVVTGMSGAGRSTALRVLEDFGYFCVDNLPPALIPRLVELLAGQQELVRIGLGIDVRTGSFLEGAAETIDALDAGTNQVDLIFLECQDDALVRRFSETRRPHPLAPGGSLLDAIHKERERLSGLRARAALIIDTTSLSVHELRRRLAEYVTRGGGGPRMTTRVISFGFKFGLPVDADLVFDVRYLPNPHFVPELRFKTGLEPEVASFVLDTPDARELLADLGPFLGRLLPRYEREGKSYLTIAVGCTGGRHRSVALAEELGKVLGRSAEVRVEHRDINAKG